MRSGLFVAGFVWFLGSCTIIPTISRTPLLDRIRSDTLSVSLGVELPLGESNDVFPDPIYEYVSYAPTEWLEFGLAGHWGIALPTIETKVDLLSAFGVDTPWSLLLNAGVGTLLNADIRGILVHGGLAGNRSFSDRFEVYGGIGSSSLSQIPIIQLGAAITPLRWLSVSGNLKIAINTRQDRSDSNPVAFMFSLSPSLVFDL